MKQLIIYFDATRDKVEHYSFNKAQDAINRDEPYITTFVPHFFSQLFVHRGYEVIARFYDRDISLNQLMENKQLRYAQNAEKMLLSGCFGDVIMNDRYEI